MTKKKKKVNWQSAVTVEEEQMTEFDDIMIVKQIYTLKKKPS